MGKSDKVTTNFDNLVSEISPDERKNLLDKITENKETDKLEFGLKDSLLETEGSLIKQMRKLSVFQRFIFWLKAIFTNQSIEIVYNNYLVVNIARHIEREYPGLIEYRHKVFYNTFYEKLLQLKNASDFFKPYINSYSANPGAFYVMLGNQIMPEIAEEIEKNSDPYQYPFDKEINNEMKFSLLRKQEEVINTLPQQNKVEVYACIRAVEWLKSFVELPLLKMISGFKENSGNVKICNFIQIGTMYNDFAKVMCNGAIITNEVLRALFYFDERRNGGKELEETEFNPGLNVFLERASNQVASISMFVDTVPVNKIACVIFNNSQFTPESCGGGEDWLKKYKAQWKNILNYRWELWIKDAKKEKLKTYLASCFNMNGFPLFPYRPWSKIKNGLFFQYEMTLGFLYAFFKSEFVYYVPALKLTSFEGEFSVRENRVEFTDTMNFLSKINEDLDVLANQLSAGGEYGLEFGKIDDTQALSKTALDHVRVMMKEIEKSTLDIINSFGKCCRTFANLMNGMLSEHITAYYGPLTNLDKINGSDNKKYRECLDKCRNGLNNAFELVKELESLDLPIQDADN